MSFNWKLTMGHLFPPFCHQLWKIIISWMSHHNAGNFTFIFSVFFESNLVKIGCLNTSNTPQTLVEPSFALGLVCSQHMYLMSPHNAGNSFFSSLILLSLLNTNLSKWNAWTQSAHAGNCFHFLFHFFFIFGKIV